MRWLLEFYGQHFKTHCSPCKSPHMLRWSDFCPMCNPASSSWWKQLWDWRWFFREGVLHQGPECSRFLTNSKRYLNFRHKILNHENFVILPRKLLLSRALHKHHATLLAEVVQVRHRTRKWSKPYAPELKLAC